RRPQRESKPREQAWWADKYRREGFGIDSKVGLLSHRRSVRSRRARNDERLDLCRDTGERLRVRHSATGGFHEHAHLYDGARNSLRTGHGSRYQGGIAYTAG